MRRVSVVGSSGAGKSTLARAIANRLAVPYVELDAFMHQAGWRPRPDSEFLDEVERATSGTGWVVDGNYMRFVIHGPVWQRADTVVWLDLPRRTVMRQVIARTVRRAMRREVLWNGNREPLSNFVSLDPDDNVILWAWVKYHEFVQRYLDAMADPRWGESPSSACDPTPKPSSGSNRSRGPARARPGSAPGAARAALPPSAAGGWRTAPC